MTGTYPTLELRRGAPRPIGTLGVMVWQGKTICYTLEEPWRGNARKVSCIPAGIYFCVPHNGAKWQNVWEVTGVPGREAILIHAGNTLADTEGCILVGMQPSAGGVAQSQNALAMLRKTLPANFWLEIKS